MERYLIIPMLYRQLGVLVQEKLKKFGMNYILKSPSTSTSTSTPREILKRIFRKCSRGFKNTPNMI